jgi:hypothetical protein
MHRCISQRASKSMDRPALPLFDGRFSHCQMLFDESNSSGKVSNIPVARTPNLMNSARLHKVFQNFVVPWKIHIYKNLILSSDASRRDASNGIRVAYVNFYHKWVLRHG